MPLPPLLPILLVLASASGALLSTGAARRALGRRRRLARIAPVSDASGLPDAVDRPIAVRGELLGGAVETGFGGGAQTIEAPHVSALPLRAPEEPRLRVGEAQVWLEGPVQVVAGTRERRELRGDDELSVRSVSERDAVIAEGLLRRVPETQRSDGGYRDPSFRYVLAPRPDPAWPGRPVALQAARPPALWPPLAALTLSLAGLALGVRGLAQPPSPLPAPAASAAPARPPCAAEVGALLDRNDPWAAAGRARGCDALSQAEAAWMLGEVDQAAAAFARARSDDPSRSPTLSEVEAAILGDPTQAAGLVKRLKTDWYKGPQDPSQTQLDCVISVLAGERTFSPFCLSDRHLRGFYGQSHRELHHQPAYALHEPDRYPLFQPLGSDDNTYRAGCGASFERLSALTDLDCRSNLAASRALFAVVVGDRRWLEEELRVVDRTLAELVRVQQLPMGQRPDPLTAKSEQEGLDELQFHVEKTLAVAAAAAWLAQDQPRLERYLPRAEAHARAILTEHLDLAAGRQRQPLPAHSPSDFSVVDLEVFAAADTRPPTAWVRQLEGLRYDSPARLRALLGPRPALREATAAWVRAGFTPLCRGCGAYALLGATFRRREAARIVGDAALADRLEAITLRLGRRLVQGPGFGPVLSLESLVAR